MKPSRLTAIILLMATFAVGLQSCRKDCDCGAVNSCNCVTDPQGNYCDCTPDSGGGCECKPDAATAYFRISTYYIHTRWMASANKITVYSNVRWCVSSSSYLVPVTEEYFEGNGEIDVDVPQNDTDKGRYFIITFTYFPDGTTLGREKVTVTIDQDPHP